MSASIHPAPLMLGPYELLQRIATGGRPVWYQTAVSEATSTVRGPSP